MAELPKDLQVGTFLKNRIKEISGLSYVVSSDHKHGKLASQQVARHMRRRAVSHDVRRLPRRLREKYKKEKVSGGGDIPAAKRPSRKYRRRAGNLLQEYNRRQMKSFWLETHIWHAKRFHMSSRWGYKIPEYPNDKCWRACYRATKSSCLMFDVSYLNLLQIKGPGTLLLENLNKLTCSSTRQIFDFAFPGREDTVQLYGRAGSTLGEVGYFWFRDQEDDENFVTIWLFCHPSFVAETLVELKAVLNINAPVPDPAQDPSVENKEQVKETEKIKIEQEESDMSKEIESENKRDIENDHKSDQAGEPKAKRLKVDPSTRGVKDVNLAKIAPRNVPAERAPAFTSPEGVELVDFQGTINRFRLIGPRSWEIIKAVCTPAKVEMSAAKVKSEITKAPSDVVTATGTKSTNEPLVECTKRDWWKEYYADRQNVAHHQLGSQLVKRMNGKSKVSQFVSLTVRDPRILLPLKRSISNLESAAKDSREGQGPEGHVELPEQAISAPFLCSSIRDAVSLSKAPDAEINAARGKLPIPGAMLNLGEAESRVPVLFLPQEDSGVDLLVPAGWGMSFWQCLVYHGCRVGGYREHVHAMIEQGQFPWILKSPDSTAGSAEADCIAEDLKSKHFALPPNKRVNYAKLGIASPFLPPWQILLQDWKSGDDWMPGGDETKTSVPLNILRDEHILDKLRAGCCEEVDGDMLVAVRLQIHAKGKLTENTLICLPSTQDLQMGCKWEGPVERIQEDTMEEDRKQERTQHQLQKKRLKRQWKKLKDKQVLLKSQSVALGTPLDETRLKMIAENLGAVKQIRNNENAAYSAKTEHLWLGEFTTVRQSCKREVIGFVNVATMSYSVGACVGFGFVALKGLKKWLSLENNPSKVVLSRETSSTQYRFSVLTVL